MKYYRLGIILSLTALLAALLGAASLHAATPAQLPGKDYVSGEVLVGLKPGVTNIQSVHVKTGANVLQTLGGRRPIQRVQLPKTTSVADALTVYRKDDRVA